MLSKVILETARLLLVPHSLEIVRARLERDDFAIHVGGVGLVHFPPEYPGDALGSFPAMRDHLEAGGRLAPGGVVIERSSLSAIGALGCKGEAVDGTMDIGYGLNPSVWNRGYATEIVRAFSDWLLEQPNIQRVTADTATSNPASGRVLEKGGFVQVGTGHSEEDGDLILWEKTVAVTTRVEPS